VIEPPPPPSRSDDAGPPLTLKGCLKPMGALLAVFSGALLLSLGLVIGRCSEAETTPVASTTVIKQGPNVVVAVRDLARLEGASFHMERVIDLKEQQSKLRGLITREDAILLVAAGDVVAGVDLTQMKASDIQIDETRRSASIVLPRATVFSARLDNSRTYVHTRTTELGAARQESLETRARQQAEKSLEADAVEAGLLRRAEDNVARTIETLVRSLGYHDVHISYQRQLEGR